MPPEPKSILNTSKRLKVVQFDNDVNCIHVNKNYYMDNVRRNSFRSNHGQSVQYTGKPKYNDSYLSDNHQIISGKHNIMSNNLYTSQTKTYMSTRNSFSLNNDKPKNEGDHSGRNINTAGSFTKRRNSSFCSETRYYSASHKTNGVTLYQACISDR